MASCNEIAVAERVIRDHVLRPYENDAYADTESWRGMPEVPDRKEIMPENASKGVAEKQDFFDDYQKEVEYSNTLPHNIVDGPWKSKEDYISAHYQILREDAIASIRGSVKSFKENPSMNDDSFTHVYTNIHVKGLLLSQNGPAFRIEFSHERAAKRIRWEQSKRLQQGTLVVLSPMKDMFRNDCKVAIVAARPIEGGLDQNPPQIDIFWGENRDAIIDPVESYVMLESRSGYFEASRHMLVALQKLRTESFHLSKHLAELDNDIGPPGWLERQPRLDLSSLIRPKGEVDATTAISRVESVEEQALCNIDVLDDFPKLPASSMDDSQMAACERMVTKKISIVQGPPGTGKTFTSVSALRVLIENLCPESPPLIIAAQTNHALDQLMNHILAFEPNVLRLGGRSDKANKEIQKRTLYMIRLAAKDFRDGYRGMKTASSALDCRIEEIQLQLAPLLTEEYLSEDRLFSEGIITEEQKDSLCEEGWANGDQSDGSDATPALVAWMGLDQLVEIPRAPQVNLGLPLEESDLEFEQLQQIEIDDEELPADKGMDALSGVWVPFRRQKTGRSQPGIDQKLVKKQLSKKNLWDIPIGMRGPVYRYWEKKLNKVMLDKLQYAMKEYISAADQLRIVKWINSFKLIRHSRIKVVGCTTTGLSKYRGLLAALQPRTLLIEEAAETLEGTIMAGMFESLEQLILVGDHQQLQAHATVQALEQRPYNLSLSMFERLVNNSMPYTMLNEQRRMVPEIRSLLCVEPAPFYPDLQDHPSVLDRNINRIPVPGMGGKDTYFFHHSWPEQKNDDLSRSNFDEAAMIVEFFNYLVLNGTDIKKITVLTFYNGQRKVLLKQLKKHSILGGNSYFNVFTVDSYQGEENDIILLSLVRSNEFMGIGFLENKNRLVVALSRARRGLYIFGNVVTMSGTEAHDESELNVRRAPLWLPIIMHMKAKRRFELNGGLPITCTKHGNTTHVHEAAEWVGLAGGCAEKCPGQLDCGHLCPYRCHPFDHSQVLCIQACQKNLCCGHGCSKTCGEDCYCGHEDCIRLAQLSLGNEEFPQSSGFGKTRSVNDSRSPPKKDRVLPIRSTIQAWKAWDAKKADREEIAKGNERRAAAASQVDRKTPYFKETFKEVKIVNGQRVVLSSAKRVIPRHEGPPMTPSSAMGNLLGLGIEDTFGGSADFDQFEKLFL